MERLIRDDRGLTDMQSTMVSVVLLLALATTIGLGVFKVIPWAQDKITELSLNTVVTAQNVARVMDGKYVSKERLTELGLISPSSAARFESRAIDTQWDGYLQPAQPRANHFVAWLTSPTGKIYLAHDGGVSAPSKTPPQTAGRFVTTWDTSIAGCQTIQLPTANTRSVRQYSWGDGTVDTDRNDKPTHTYTDTPGIKTVVYEGKFGNLDFYSNPSAHCLISIEEWQDTGVTTMSGAFQGTTNLVKVAEIPNTVTDMSALFINNGDIKVDVTNWDVSNVQSMLNMFSGASNFNQDISRWDTGNVRNMNGLFRGARSFSQDINGWNVEKVTTARNMFDGAIKFDRPLDRWFNKSSNNGAGPSLLDASYMFYRSELFNQPLNTWHMNNVTAVGNMFEGALKFNGDVSSWKLPKVKDFTRMFSGARVFNSNISAWDVSGGEIFKFMFAGSGGHPMAFNQNIGGWNMSRAKDLASMFDSSTSFNQNLDRWKPTKATTVANMFFGATSFNGRVDNLVTSSVLRTDGMFEKAISFSQPLATWDVSKVTNMRRMFYNAQKFDQDLSGWNVSGFTGDRSNIFDLAPIASTPSKHPQWVSP